MNSTTTMKKRSKNGWNTLFYSENIITSDRNTIHEFTIKIGNLHSDKSGIIIGLMKAANKSVSLSSVSTNFIAISGNGFQLNYNTVRIRDYDLETGDIVKISINLRSSIVMFNVKGIDIGSGSYDLISVLNTPICLGVLMYHKNNEVQHLEYKISHENTHPKHSQVVNN